MHGSGGDIGNRDPVDHYAGLILDRNETAVNRRVGFAPSSFGRELIGVGLRYIKCAAFFGRHADLRSKGEVISHWGLFQTTQRPCGL